IDDIKKSHELQAKKLDEALKKMNIKALRLKVEKIVAERIEKRMIKEFKDDIEKIKDEIQEETLLKKKELDEAKKDEIENLKMTEYLEELTKQLKQTNEEKEVFLQQLHGAQ